MSSRVISVYVTPLALDAVAKYVVYQVMNIDSVIINLPQVISSLTHCRFKAGDSSRDDDVLLKVPKLLEGIVESDISDVLSCDCVKDAYHWHVTRKGVKI